MKRLILTTSAILLFFISQAQNDIVIIESEGEKDTTAYQAYNQKFLFTDSGNYPIENIYKVTFMEFADPDLVELLEGNGVTVEFIDIEGFDPIYQNINNQTRKVRHSLTGGDDFGSPYKPFEGTDEERIDLLIEDVVNFNSQRNIGKGLQVLGLVLAIVGSTQAEDGSTIVIIGGVSSIIGFGVDFAAGTHLKRVERLRK